MSRLVNRIAETISNNLVPSPYNSEHYIINLNLKSSNQLTFAQNDYMLLFGIRIHFITFRQHQESRRSNYFHQLT